MRGIFDIFQRHKDIAVFKIQSPIKNQTMLTELNNLHVNIFPFQLLPKMLLNTFQQAVRVHTRLLGVSDIMHSGAFDIWKRICYADGVCYKHTHEKYIIFNKHNSGKSRSNNK